MPLNIRNARARAGRAAWPTAGPRALVRDPTLPDPGFDGPTFGLDDWDALPAGSAPVEPPPVDEDAPAELFYTSGSTGRPKGAVLSHRALYLHAVHNALTNGITGDDVLLHTIPLFHVNGWGTAHFLTGLGGTHVMLPRFDAGEVLRLVERERVDAPVPRPHHGADAARPPRRRRPATSRRSRQASIGGAPSTPELLAEVEDDARAARRSAATG